MKKKAKLRPADSSLLHMADAYIKRNPAMNPPGDDTETRFDQFILEMKSSGQATNKWGESEWYQAALRFGFDEDDASMALEQVASWGVDD